MMQINPYLNYDGDAEAAFRFYQSVLGGELFVQRMGDAPGNESLSEQERQRAMHVSLPIGKNLLMASDCSAADGSGFLKGNNFYISITPESREDADRIFAGLSAGGQIEMPMADMFWGDYFGSFIDKFGIGWMVNFPTAKKDA
jgi:PhnB protein